MNLYSFPKSSVWSVRFSEHKTHVAEISQILHVFKETFRLT